MTGYRAAVVALCLGFGSALSCGDDGGGGQTTTEGTGGGSPEFVFNLDPPESYTQTDRAGMPAINTAVITSKDAYNAASPADDAAGMFVPEIVENVTFLHTALDDDLTTAGLTPCVPMDCIDFAAPLVVPDVIKIDTSAPAGFPNGRLPADPVVDVTLAVVLLDMTTHTPTTLAGLPLNPPENDKPFLEVFPYLAEPHD